jgi:hypothetical protein
MPVTSTTQSPANTPSSHARARSPRRSHRATQVIDASVMPNDSPKVTALRQDTGPSHGRESTAKTTRWNNPDATSAAATA